MSPATALTIFDYPWLLALALLLPVATVLLVLAGVRRRRARLARLGSSEMVRRLVPSLVLARPTWRVVRLGLATLLAAVALAGPRWGAGLTASRSAGVDVVLVLDASLSMLAQDERPSRLERMKVEVRRLRAQAGGDRIGLLAFAGRSYILTPLTTDDGALDLYLANFDPSIVGQPGTSLSRAIAQATSLLQSTKSVSDKAIVVMTDGETHEPTESVVEAARKVREAGIAFVAVGFGTPAGTTIPVRAPDGSMSTKEDDAGAVVVTLYRPDVLRAAADAAGGTFIDAAETDRAGRVRSALSTLKASTNTSTAAGRRTRTARFQLFLLPAFLLLLADTLLADRRGGRRSRLAAASEPSDEPPVPAVAVPAAATAPSSSGGAAATGRAAAR